MTGTRLVFADGTPDIVAHAENRAGWARLSVIQEHALGVATMRVDSDTAHLLTIKPGSYVWPKGMLVPATPGLNGGLELQVEGAANGAAKRNGTY